MLRCLLRFLNHLADTAQVCADISTAQSAHSLIQLHSKYDVLIIFLRLCKFTCNTAMFFHDYAIPQHEFFATLQCTSVLNYAQLTTGDLHIK
jgi:hypothetical protein